MVLITIKRQDYTDRDNIFVNRVSTAFMLFNIIKIMKRFIVRSFIY